MSDKRLRTARTFEELECRISELERAMIVAHGRIGEVNGALRRYANSKLAIGMECELDALKALLETPK